MVLTVWVPSSRPLAQVRYVSESDVRVLVAGSQEFVEYFEKLRGNDRVVLQAHSGDTLASMALRYHVNISTLERVNRRSRSARLMEGDAIIIYVPHGKTPKAARAPSDVNRVASPVLIEPVRAEPSAPGTADSEGRPGSQPDSG